MIEKIMRYLVPGQGPDVEALKRCIAFAVKLSQENDFTTVTFLVPVKSNFVLAWGRAKITDWNYMIYAMNVPRNKGYMHVFSGKISIIGLNKA